MFYGIAHRRTLQKAHDEEKARHAVHDRTNLIAQAKEAWKRKQEGSKDGGESLFLLHMLGTSPSPLRHDTISGTRSTYFCASSIMSK